MPDDLYRPIARALTPSALGLLARNLGETTGAVRTALDGAVSSALRVAIAKSASDAGAQEVLDVVRDGREAVAGLLTGSPPGFEARLRAADPADPLVTSSGATDRLFSGRAPGLATHLASFARIKPESAGALLRLGTSLALASLHDAGASVETPAGLRRRLRAEAEAVRAVTPRGFDPDLGAASVQAPGDDRARWLPWLLAALLLVVLIVVAARGRQDEAPAVETVSAPAEPAPGPAV